MTTRATIIIPTTHMDNPRIYHAECSSETEYQAMAVFHEAFRRAFDAGMLDGDWLVGVYKKRDGRIQPQIVMQPRSPF